ncbi:MCE family protein [Jatrophihabitans sp. YIM 134969]
MSRNGTATGHRGVVATAIAVAVVVVLGMTALIWYLSGDHGRTPFSATFAGTVGVYPGSDVRMLGVKVGQVDSIEPQGTGVLVKAHLDSGYAAQPDTEAVIFSPSLVSDRYVQLTKVWTSGPKLAADAEIPLDRTATPVELDQIYSSVLSLTDALGPNGANANGALSDLLDTSAANLGGNGRALNEALTQFSAASGTLSSNRNNLFASIDNLSQFTTMLQRNDQSVAGLNQRLASVSQTLADDRQTFAAALQQLSAALTTVQGFIADNRETLTADVDKLSQITQVLVSERDSLEQALSSAPLLVQNLINTYDPNRNLLVGRGNLNELSLWTAVDAVSPNASSPSSVSSSGVVTSAADPADAPPLLLPSAGATS